MVSRLACDQHSSCTATVRSSLLNTMFFAVMTSKNIVCRILLVICIAYMLLYQFEQIFNNGDLHEGAIFAEFKTNNLVPSFEEEIRTYSEVCAEICSKIKPVLAIIPY